MNSSKRVAIYARVSTEGQADDGFSIDAQLENLKKFSEFFNNTVVCEYVDYGISGKSMDNRPALLRMLEDAKNGKFDEVLVWKLNRLARNHFDLLKIYDILENVNVSFRSSTESFETGSPSGKLLFSMLGCIGEFERETIVDNVKSGMKQRAKQGYFNGGRMLGYKSVISDDSKIKSEIVVIEEEASSIRWIFDWYVSGIGYKGIAKRLNELGVKTVKDNSFNIQAVRNILMNPTYAGYIRYNKYVNHSKKRRKGNEQESILVKGNHEAIISEETWAKASAIFESNKCESRKVTKGVFILTGILKCPQCGSSMVAGRVCKTEGGDKRYYNYYQCSRYKNYGSCECSANSIRAELAEKTVINMLQRFAFNDEVIEDVISGLNRQVESTIAPIKSQLEAVHKKSAESENRKSRLFKLYEEAIIDSKSLKARLDELEEEEKENIKLKQALIKQLDESEITTIVPVERVKRLLKNVGVLMDKLPREQQKRLLNAVVSHIETDNLRSIKTIHLRFSETMQKQLLREESSDEGSSFFMPFMLKIENEVNFAVLNSLNSSDDKSSDKFNN